MMRLGRWLVLAAVVGCFSTTVLAQNVQFNNNDGTWTWSSTGTNANDLVLSGSALASVSGLPSTYNCASIAACGGTVSIVTGGLTSGPTSLNPGACNGSPNPCAPATFAPGGSFMVTGESGALTFDGSFSSETWQKTGSKGTAFWTFVGSIANATLTLGGTTYTMVNAGTFDITTVGAGSTGSTTTGLKWTDNFGSTNFPSPVPEPSTLALFGSGLVFLGLIAKRKLSRNDGNPTL